MAKIYDHTFLPWKCPNRTRVVAAETTWNEPLKWDRAAAKAGERHRVFCASLADVFEDWSGPMVDSNGRHLVHTVNGWESERTEQHESCSGVTMADVRKQLFDLIDATPNLDWQLLTKRPENIAKMWHGSKPKLATAPHHKAGTPEANIWYRPNVWLLTSVSDQQTADAMIPPLLQCRNLSPVLGLSMEPLLGPVDIKFAMPWERVGIAYKASISWIITGGESGTRARPMHPQWVLDIRDQCQAAGVPFFYKQWGEWAPYYDVGAPFTEKEILGDKMAWVSPDGRWSTAKIRPNDFSDGTVLMSRVGKDAAGRLLDGRTWDELPKVSVTNG